MRNRFNSEIILRALVESVVNIGQLTHQNKLDLEYAVRKGWLSKGKGGAYPILKTVYARPGFDFVRERERLVTEMRRMAMLDYSVAAIEREFGEQKKFLNFIHGLKRKYPLQAQMGENGFPCRKCGVMLAPTSHEARKCPKCKVWTFKPTGHTKAEEEGR